MKYIFSSIKLGETNEAYCSHRKEFLIFWKSIVYYTPSLALSWTQGQSISKVDKQLTEAKITTCEKIIRCVCICVNVSLTYFIIPVREIYHRDLTVQSIRTGIKNPPFLLYSILNLTQKFVQCSYEKKPYVPYKYIYFLD